MADHRFKLEFYLYGDPIELAGDRHSIMNTLGLLWGAAGLGMSDVTITNESTGHSRSRGGSRIQLSDLVDLLKDL